jgi:hypothetical protein
LPARSSQNTYLAPLIGLPGVGNKGNRVSWKRKREEIQDCVALSSNGKDSTKTWRPEANSSTTKTVTSYDNSTTTTCGYLLKIQHENNIA